MTTASDRVHIKLSLSNALMCAALLKLLQADHLLHPGLQEDIMLVREALTYRIDEALTELAN